jgi:glucan phosphoethanolaminetransferase (alkaline phosphatase superfamily)
MPCHYAISLLFHAIIFRFSRFRHYADAAIIFATPFLHFIFASAVIFADCLLLPFRLLIIIAIIAIAAPTPFCRRAITIVAIDAITPRHCHATDTPMPCHTPLIFAPPPR